MDPLSIITATGGLVSQAGKLAKLLYDLHESRKDAPLLVSYLSSQCNIVATSLGYIWADMQRSRESCENLQAEQIYTTFDMTLTSCFLTLSTVERELEACTKPAPTGRGRDQRTPNVRLIRMFFAEDHLRRLSDQLSSQVQAATLLVTIWQSRSIEQMKAQVANNRYLLGGITRTATKRYAESVLSSNNAPSSATLADSVTGNHHRPYQADYEKDLLSSPAYRRALRYSSSITTEEVAEYLDGADSTTAMLSYIAEEPMQQLHTISKASNKRKPHADPATKEQLTAKHSPDDLAGLKSELQVKNEQYRALQRRSEADQLTAKLREQELSSHLVDVKNELRNMKKQYEDILQTRSGANQSKTAKTKKGVGSARLESGPNLKQGDVKARTAAAPATTSLARAAQPFLTFTCNRIRYSMDYGQLMCSMFILWVTLGALVAVLPGSVDGIVWCITELSTRAYKVAVDSYELVPTLLHRARRVEISSEWVHKSYQQVSNLLDRAVYLVISNYKLQS